MTIVDDLTAAAALGQYGLSMAIQKMSAMQVSITAWGYKTPSFRPDPDQPATLMTVSTAPAGNVPGTFTANYTFTSEGPHEVVVETDTLRVHKVWTAGDTPAWDPDAIADNQPGARQARSRRQAQQMLGVRSHIG
jgi:hypothetical protein